MSLQVDAFNSNNSSEVLNHGDLSSFSIKVSAPGKIILHGEHSVVYRKLALAASINLRTYLYLDEIPNNTVKSSIYIGYTSKCFTIDLQKFKNAVQSLSLYNCSIKGLLDPDHFLYDKAKDIVDGFISNDKSLSDSEAEEHRSISVILILYLAIMLENSIDSLPFNLKVESDIKPGTGTGSSASFSVCVSAIFIQYLKRTLIKSNFSKSEWREKYPWLSCDLDYFSKTELNILNKYAYFGERILHGKPSGIDNTVCTFGQFVQFRIGETPVVKKKMCSGSQVLLINSRVSRNTKQLVQKLAELRNTFPKIVDEIMVCLDYLTHSAIDILEKMTKLNKENMTECEEFQTAFHQLERLVDINHNLLKSLGASHPVLEEIIGLLSEQGFHGKLTGAGGGGNVICYVSGDIHQAKVHSLIQTLTNRGFEAFFVELGVEGVMIHSK